jgi:hypothetical protein
MPWSNALKIPQLPQDFQGKLLACSYAPAPIPPDGPGGSPRPLAGGGGAQAAPVRQTTLARQLVPAASANTFDLEDPISLARLDQPLTALGELRGTVVIDEVQRRPELFPLLRVLADRADRPARFLILGSRHRPCCGSRRNHWRGG